MADKIAYRKAYNALKTQQRQEQSETLRRFAEAHPERYAELMTQAQHEVEGELTSPQKSVGHSIGELIDASRLRETAERFDALVREGHKGMRDYIIRAKDNWGDEHTLFLGFPIPHVPQPNEKIKTPIKGTEYTVIDATPCTCPLCR